MENKETQYQNARPSTIANIGEDIKGAQRHNFKTYDEQQELKAKNKVTKSIKKELDSLKEKAIESQCKEDLLAYHLRYLQLKYNFKSVDVIDLKTEVQAMRVLAKARSTSEAISTFNKALRALDKFRRVQWAVERDCSYSIARHFKKLEPKAAFRYVENNGKTFNWSSLDQASNPENIDFLSKELRALQFGNSVPDKERIYLTNALTEDLKTFMQTFKHIDLSPLGLSFGARGKAGSVAYFQPDSNIISVNRHNIGSLIHEIGHYLDYNLTVQKLSNLITREMRAEYRDKLQANKIDPRHMSYLLKPTEIFARLFENYCLSLNCFKEFSLTVDESIMPDLNEVNLKFITDCISKELSNEK